MIRTVRVRLLESTAPGLRGIPGLSGRRELLSLFGQQNGQQPRGLGLTGVAGNRVELIWSFDEHLTRVVSLFGTVSDFRPHLAFDNIGDRNARMPVGTRILARPV